MFGFPEALLFDRGANLLSHLMQDVCKILGIRILNTTSHHPQCNGMTKKFNSTLKTMLRKLISKFGVQWDNYLYEVLWAYRNFPYPSTGEQPSFLLYGCNCRHPTEAALLPTSLGPTDVSHYREELVLSVLSVRVPANKANTKTQSRQKAQYDKLAVSTELKAEDWVLICFPEGETGKFCKLSRSWHGPYQIIDWNDPNISAKKLFFPDDPGNNHEFRNAQSRVQKCPSSFPKDFWWYGGKGFKAGKPPKQVLRALEAIESILEQPRMEAGLLKQVDMADDSSITDKTYQRSGGPLESSTCIDPERVQSKKSKQSPDIHYNAEEFVIYPQIIAETLGTSLYLRGTDIEVLINVATI